MTAGGGAGDPSAGRIGDLVAEALLAPSVDLGHGPGERLGDGDRAAVADGEGERAVTSSTCTRAHDGFRRPGLPPAQLSGSSPNTRTSWAQRHATAIRRPFPLPRGGEIEHGEPAVDAAGLLVGGLQQPPPVTITGARTRRSSPKTLHPGPRLADHGMGVHGSRGEPVGQVHRAARRRSHCHRRSRRPPRRREAHPRVPVRARRRHPDGARPSPGGEVPAAEQSQSEHGQHGGGDAHHHQRTGPHRPTGTARRAAGARSMAQSGRPSI